MTTTPQHEVDPDTGHGRAGTGDGMTTQELPAPVGPRWPAPSQGPSQAPSQGPGSAYSPLPPTFSAPPPTMSSGYVPPIAPGQPGPAAGGGGRPRGGGRRLAEVAVVAVVAAGLASGATAVLVRHDQGTTTSSAVNLTSGQQAVLQTSANAPDWTATAKAVSPSVVSIDVASSTAEGEGSGVVIDTEGHILTNNHVATGAGSGAKITVSLDDGRQYAASVVGTDPTTDLAVLKLANPPSDLKAISFGDSGALVVGQPVMAVGNPLGLSGTVTTGIVSALNRPVTTAASDSQQGQSQQGSPLRQVQPQTQGTTSDQEVFTDAIQTSAPINPGNSGGALVTADGQLVGINSSIASLSSSSSSSQSGSIGIGFAIPANEAKSVASQLIATGKVQHAYLGVTIGDGTANDGTATRSAAIVGQVTSGSPAAAAGLQAKDAIVAINGQSVSGADSLIGQIRAMGVGDKAQLTVVRGGSSTQVTVTLAAQPTN